MAEPKIPVTVYAEMTPNPATMKFVANKYLLIENRAIEFDNLKEAQKYSPIAAELLQFPFVENVFITSNFVTITKTYNVDWDFIAMELREFIKNWIADGKDIIVMMPPEGAETTQREAAIKHKKDFTPSAFDEPIIAILDQYVRPAVENDGGAIDYVGYEDGVVTVELKGACAGCPSSTATLKGGIEHLLKSNIKEVKEVVAYSV